MSVRFAPAVAGCVLMLASALAGAQPVYDWTLPLDAGGTDQGRGLAVWFISPFVVGSTEAPGTNSNPFLSKIDPITGALTWTKYQSAASSFEDSQDIYASPLGDLYVLCTTVPVGGNLDITVSKYDYDGNLAWQKTWNGPGNSTDVGSSITADAAGNVYFAGRSFTGLGLNSYDMCVGKYDKDGNFQWAKTFNGAQQKQDSGVDIAVDATGSTVYVGGFVNDSAATGIDACLWSYSGSGILLDRAVYPGSQLSGETISSVRMLSTGNIAIAGHAAPAVGGTLDYFVRCVSSSDISDNVWEATYDGPGAGVDMLAEMEVDADDNVFVTGTSFQSPANGSGWATRKYNSSGAVQWTARYDAAGSEWNYAKSLSLDSVGNCYVTGDGVMGVEGANVFTRKLAPNGGTVWSDNYHAGHGDDVAVEVEVTVWGDIYILGTSQGAASKDVFIRKFHQAPVTIPDAYSSDEGVATISGEVDANDVYAGVAQSSVVDDVDHGTLSLNKNGTFTYTPDAGFVGTDTFTYKVTRPFANPIDSNVAAVSLKVVPVGFTLSLNPTKVIGGAASTGTVNSSSAAAGAGLTFTLGDNTSAITTPAFVSIAPGALESNFAVDTLPVVGTVVRQVTATRGGVTKIANLTLDPGGLSTLTVTPNNLYGGQPAKATVQLAGVAPAGGRTVAISDNSVAIATPASVDIAAGAGTGSFDVTTSVVQAQVVRTVSATLDNITRTANLTLKPGHVVLSLSLQPGTVKGGQPVTATVTLNQPAPAGGITVTLADNSAALNTPPTVIVPQGAVSAQFQVTTVGVAQQAVRTVTATYNASVTASLILTP